MKKWMLFLLAVLFVIPASASAAEPQLIAGDLVTMGQYEQDGNISNGTEPIDWLVLDVDDVEGKALVISKYSLDRFLYHNKYEPVTWETCDLRGMLNDDFLNTVFSSDEIQRILFSQVHTPDNTTKGTKGGNDTIDRIFLLSAEEAELYFPSDEDRNGLSTTYLGQLCDFTNGLEYTRRVWWLRTPGEIQSHAAYVHNGRVNLGGWGGNMHKLPIRPAMWISMDTAS